MGNFGDGGGDGSGSIGDDGGDGGGSIGDCGNVGGSFGDSEHKNKQRHSL